MMHMWHPSVLLQVLSSQCNFLLYGIWQDRCKFCLEWYNSWNLHNQLVKRNWASSQKRWQVVCRCFCLAAMLHLLGCILLLMTHLAGTLDPQTWGEDNCLRFFHRRYPMAGNGRRWQETRGCMRKAWTLKAVKRKMWGPFFLFTLGGG